MRKQKKSQLQHGDLYRVSQGLYRSSASGKYFAHVRIHGKLFRKSLKTADLTVAKRKLADFRKAREKVDPNAGRITIEAFCKIFAETLKPLSPSSIKAKTGILKRLKDEWPGGARTLLTEVKASDCEVWIGKQAVRMGRSHLNAYIQLLKDFFELALRDHMLAENPAGHLHYRKREKPIRLAPKWEEFKQIVQDIRTQKFNADAQDSADFVEFLGLAGQGVAETGGLRWRDVDWERNQIIIYRHKTDQGYPIPIFPQLRPLLEKLKNSGPHSHDDQVLRIKSAKKALAGACRRLELPNYTHISFRRMFITRALELGVDVKVVAQWQGHRDGGKLILDTYSHVRPLHAAAMAELMAST